MALRYINPTATYNGDGTTSSDAASAGAAGAWNNLINCFSGSPGYGTLSAGDTVYVKCPTGTTTITLGATLTFSSTPTRALPITWIFDDGVVWSGNSGLINIKTNTAGTYYFSFTNFHNFISNNGNGVCFYSDYNLSSAVNVWAFGENYMKGIRFDCAATGNGKSTRYLTSVTGAFTAVDCYFAVKNSFNNTYPTFILNPYCPTLFINCEFDMTGNYDGDRTIFGCATPYGNRVDFIGGKVTGSTENNWVFSGVSSTQIFDIAFDGFDPGLLKLDLRTEYTTLNANSVRAMYQNIPNTLFGSSIVTSIYSVHWRNGQNYPTLNAVLPDTNNTPWSYKVYPKNTSQSMRTEFPLREKFYLATAATKTITVELLISNNYTNPKQNEWWMQVLYTDATTGAIYKQSSYEVRPVGGSTDLAAGSSGWSTTTYGATSYTPYKMSVTTSTTIKQNSIIYVKIFSGRAAPSSSDFYFVDPEITLS